MRRSETVARRVRVVDGRFQYRAIAVSLSVVLVGLLVFAGVTGLYHGIASAAGKAPSPRMLLVILPPLLLNDLAIMVVAIIVGIVTSHRIAGPVYRIAADIDRALGGERGVRVNLRPKDDLAELADRVNALLERFDDVQAR